MRFNKKVKLTAYEVGNITPSGVSYIQVTHNFPSESQATIKMAESKVENIQVNCLILAISNQTSSDESDGYVVVLDYSNHKSYMVKTNLLYSWDNRLSLHLIDITGDGQQDIIISNVLNGYKSGTTCEIFRYDKANDTLKSIYVEPSIYVKQKDSAEPEDKIKYFSGYLIDDYQAVVECQQIGFKKKISLLDLGYKKEDLEIDKAPKERMNDVMQYNRCYKKGKVITKENNINLTIAPLDDDMGIQVYSNPNIEKGLRLKYYIYMGKWNGIGAAYAYMGYDKASDSLKVIGATVEENKYYEY